MLPGMLPDEFELRGRLLLVLGCLRALGIFCRESCSLQASHRCSCHLAGLYLQLLGGTLVVSDLGVEVGLPRSLGSVFEGAHRLPGCLCWARIHIGRNEAGGVPGYVPRSRGAPDAMAYMVQ